MSKAQSFVEVVSNGSGPTHVYLVIKDGNGAELRYEIPNVVDLTLSVDARGAATLRLDLAGVQVRSTMVLRSGQTTAEDLISEIVASRLANDKDEPHRWLAKDHAPHASHCAVVAIDRLFHDACDCGASEPGPQ